MDADEIKAKKQRENYAHYQQLGICTSCRKQPATDDSTRCIDCNELRKKKYFKPRTEETRSQLNILPSERNDYVINRLKDERILTKRIGRSLYKTTRGNSFLICTIAIHRHGIQSEPLYRVRNENRIPCDYILAVLPEDGSFYIFPNDGRTVFYFHIDDVEEFKEDFNTLL